MTDAVINPKWEIVKKMEDIEGILTLVHDRGIKWHIVLTNKSKRKDDNLQRKSRWFHIIFLQEPKQEKDDYILSSEIEG